MASKLLANIKKTMIMAMESCCRSSICCVYCFDSMRAPRNHLSTEIPYFNGVARMCGSVSQNSQRINSNEYTVTRWLEREMKEKRRRPGALASERLLYPSETVL